MRSTVHERAPQPSLLDGLEDWVDAGLITNEQARAIRQHDVDPRERRVVPVVVPSPETGPPLVIEALGYLGGLVMLTGAGTLAAIYWADLSTGLRLAVIGATAFALVVAGFAVPHGLGDAAGRLRSVLWAAGVAATAGFFGVFSTELLGRHDEHALVVIGAGTAVVAGILWRLRATWLQQLSLFVPLMVAAVGTGMELTSTSSSWAGAATWAVAIVWVVCSWAGQLEPRVTGVSLGVLGAVLGTMLMHTDAGIALGLATSVAAAVVALWERNLPWLGLAAIALLWTMPRAADAWFPGRLSAALTLIATGGVLVVAAVWAEQRQGRQPS